VALSGDPLDAAESLGVGSVPADEVLVDLLRHVDERVVRGHLIAVQRREAECEGGAQS
jgi:hypothetical protein